ncbi:MAG: hypothetical protein K8R54_02450 [Bacteroidales bacterium]|nr:hypothetical protein [Bacteroidales bacterium]
MKKTAILLAFLILISFSCNKKYRFYAFDIKETIEYQIPGNSSENFNIINELELNIERIFEQEGTEADMVEEISVEEVSFAIGQYQLFNDLKVYISTAKTDETLLASNDSAGVDYSGDLVKLAVTENLIDDHIKASLVNIKTQAILDTVAIENALLGLPDSMVAFPITYNLRFRVQTYVK